MHGFLSHYTNKLDAKGRVSVPAAFRSELTRDGYDGLYCIPSPHAPAIDAGGYGLLSEINKRLGGLHTLTADHDLMSTALFGISERLKIDGDGRVMVSELMRSATGIDGAVTFVGLGYKFQIWHPDRFEAQRREAMERAFGLLGRPGAGAASSPLSAGPGGDHPG